MQCYRVSDGETVPESEALDATGLRTGYSVRQPFVRPGDYLSFDIMMCDTARPPCGAEASSLSSSDREAVIARAQMIHRTSNAYLGDQAPAFTEAMAQLAVRKAESDVARVHAADAAFVAAGNHQRAEADLARAQMIDSIRNAWRN